MSRYFQQLREDWILEAIQIFGFVQRGHLCAKFEISPQQATKDFQRFQETHPNVMRYDVKLKAYRAAEEDFCQRLILLRPNIPTE
jgi:hypothetical protein